MVGLLGPEFTGVLGLSLEFELVSELTDGADVPRREGMVEEREGLLECGASDLAAVIEEEAEIGGAIGAPNIEPVRKGRRAGAGRRGGPV